MNRVTIFKQIKGEGEMCTRGAKSVPTIPTAKPAIGARWFGKSHWMEGKM